MERRRRMMHYSFSACALLSISVMPACMTHANMEQRNTNYPDISYVILELALQTYKVRKCHKMANHANNTGK
jgi:hypothetical protein